MRIINISIGILFLLVSALTHAASGPKAIEFWNASDESSTTEVSHADWQYMLDTYLKTDASDKVNRFDYAKVTKKDKKRLQSYLKNLQKLDPRSLNKREQYAYWTNLYNALTVDVVLSKYPVESIRSIRFLTSPFGPWDKNLLEIQGKDLSLNDIEHGILRPIWKDPRTHFLVNCASYGCPSLLPTAFTADNFEALQDQAARDFIGHPRGVKIEGDTLHLSSIFDWYGGDFGESQAEINAYLKQYMDESVEFDPNKKYTVKFDYDWSINEVPQAN